MSTEVQVYEGDGQPWQDPGRPLTTGSTVSNISIEEVNLPPMAVHLSVNRDRSNDPNSIAPWVSIVINARIGEFGRLDLSTSPLLVVLKSKHEEACKPADGNAKDYKFTLVSSVHGYKFLGALVTKMDFMEDTTGDHWVTFILTADKAVPL